MIKYQHQDELFQTEKCECDNSIGRDDDDDIKSRKGRMSITFEGIIKTWVIVSMTALLILNMMVIK